MDNVNLEATIRQQTGKGASRQLRRKGFVPSVAYKGGTPTLELAVSHEALAGILLSDRGRNSVIQLHVEGKDKTAVMIKDYTVHPVSRQLVHADFIQVDVNQTLEVEVPFQAIGRSKGEMAGGTLVQNVRQLRVRCLPANIPDIIEADVTELEIDDVLRVEQLAATAAGVELLHRSDQKLLVVQPPRVEEEEAPEEGEGEEGADGEAPVDGEAPADGKPADGKPEAAADGDK
jgi:large subunit ribosomal protein L25